jgi:phosphatidylcholine synthase
VRLAAALVHIFTALGAVCALLAIDAIGDRAWEHVFLWLGIAFIIDGIDGTFARLVHVKERLPRFSGEILDLVVDYLTYVLVPALALIAAGKLAGALGTCLAAAILLSSLYHFADTKNKADDLNFVGFPAVWNIVAFYLFVFGAGEAVTAAVTALSVALTFVPMKWVHPLRVVALRPVTLAMTLAWSLAAITVVWTGFAAAPWLAKASLLVVAAYAIGLSLVWSRLKGMSARS